MAAQAIDSPSKVAVPRPISSRITSERPVAWFRIAAVSTISTMKVERPRARSSAAPTRENSRSTTPIWASAAGTKAPAWARMAMSAFWRRKVDLPAMLGPVTTAMRPPVALCRAGPSVPERSQPLATKSTPLAFSAASTTGWRPPSMRKASERSTTGRTQPRVSATSPSAKATSMAASASPAARIASASARTAATRPSNSATLDGEGAVGRAWRCGSRARPVPRSRTASRPPWSGGG